MNVRIEKDAKALGDILSEIADYSTAYLDKIGEGQTEKDKPVKFNSKLDNNGVGTRQALRIFFNKYNDCITARTGPRFLSFVNGGVTPAALAGDWLTPVYDLCPQSGVDEGGDVSAAIEIDTIHLLKQLLNLPEDFFGCFVSGASMSGFTGLAIAREWAGRKLNLAISENGLEGTENIEIFSCTPHSSTIKALTLLGFGRNKLQRIPSIKNRESVDIPELEAEIKKHLPNPIIFIASAGTVNTSDFDDFAALADLKKRYDFWLHVDGAFGGFASCSTTYRHLFKGLEVADSFTVDCHKWMNLPYDSGLIFTKQKHNDLHRETFKNVSAKYLGNESNFHFFDYVPENSRRLRALPALVSMMAYGKDGFKELVDHCCHMAAELGRLIKESDQFLLLSPVRLNITCFTLNPATISNTEENVAKFLQTINKRGVVNLSPTVYNGYYGIRAAFVNWRITESDVKLVWSELNRT